MPTIAWAQVLSRFLETGAARNAFEEALELDPKLAAAHVNLALILAQADELSAAHEHLDRAIGLRQEDKDAASAYFVRAMVWSAQGDNQNAIVDLKHATANCALTTPQPGQIFRSCFSAHPM